MTTRFTGEHVTGRHVEVRPAGHPGDIPPDRYSPKDQSGSSERDGSSWSRTLICAVGWTGRYKDRVIHPCNLFGPYNSKCFRLQGFIDSSKRVRTNTGLMRKKPPSLGWQRRQGGRAS